MAIRGSSLAGVAVPVGGPAGLPGQSTFAAWLTLPGNAGKSIADFMAAQKGADGLIRSIGGVAKSAVDLDDLKITFGGVQRGLPSAVSLFNDRTAVSIFEYLPAQYHNPIAAGTLATGIAGDLTAAWAAAAAQIGDAELFHPPGRYLLDGEAILNAPLALAMKGVRFLQIAAPGNGNRGMIRVNSGAARARVLGAPGFDGNRDALIDAYRAGDVINQGNRYSVAGSWAAVFVNGAEDVYIDVIRAKNMMTMGLLHLAGDGLMVDHMRVRNSSKILLSQFARGGVIEDVWGDQISNVAGGKTVPTYQYAVECRNLTQSRFGTLRVTNYAPLVFDGTASSASAMGVGDPHAAAVSFDHMDGLDVGAIRAAGFGPASTDARVSNVAWGFLADSIRAMKVGHVEAKGYYWGVEQRTWIGCQVGSVDLDGRGNTAGDGSGVAVSAGIRTKGYGGLPSNLSLSSSYDHVSIVPSRGNTWGPGVVQGFTHGVHQISGGNEFFGIDATNNEQQGWVWWKSEAGPFGKVLPLTSRLVNCSGRANGQCGALILDLDDGEIIGGAWDDNGQRTSVQQYANGISFDTNSIKGRLRVIGGTASDTQSWTETGGVSFAPGMVGSDGRWPIVLGSGANKRPGQNVVIVNGGGPGVNITARIVSMQLDSPSAMGPARTIVAVAAGTVFSETGNLVALSGTVTLPPGSALLAGSGTSFTSQITSECVMKAAGQYLQVGQVLSDTQLQIDTSQSAPIASAPAQVIRCDLKGRPSQAWGRYIPAGMNLTAFSYRDQVSEGNLYGNVYVGDWSVFPLGQEVLLDTGSYPLSTSGNTTLLLPWYVNVFPETWQALGMVAQITAAVTGTTGATLKVAAYNNGGAATRSVMATFPALTKNTQARGIPAAVFTGDANGSLAIVAAVEGGSGNTPTGGSVRAQLLIRKVAPPSLPAVP